MSVWPAPELEATYFTFLNLSFLIWIRVQHLKAVLREDLRDPYISSAKKCAQRVDALFLGCQSIVPLPVGPIPP